jgi:hypothetical protein
MIRLTSALSFFHTVAQAQQMQEAANIANNSSATMKTPNSALSIGSFEKWFKIQGNPYCCFYHFIQPREKLLCDAFGVKIITKPNRVIEFKKVRTHSC